MAEGGIKQHLFNARTWLRGVFMLIFALTYTLGEFVLVAVAVFQFVAHLFTGRSNAHLLRFGQQLSTYLYQVLLFVTFNSETHPYPLSAWPSGAPGGEEGAAGGGARSAAPRKKTAARKRTAAKKKPAGGAPKTEPPEGTAG